MTVGDLIKELDQYDHDLPICINDYIGFVEIHEKTIEVQRKEYTCFPFTENDKIAYINLKGQQFDY